MFHLTMDSAIPVGLAPRPLNPGPRHTIDAILGLRNGNGHPGHLLGLRDPHAFYRRQLSPERQVNVEGEHSSVVVQDSTSKTREIEAGMH